MNGALGDFERRGGLLHGQAAEEAAFDDACGPFALPGQPLERGVQLEDVVREGVDARVLLFERDGRPVASEDGRVPAVVLATIYVGRGEPEEAIRWFERSFENREWQMIFLPHEPMFDPLRDDPRFQDLVARVGP